MTGADEMVALVLSLPVLALATAIARGPLRAALRSEAPAVPAATPAGTDADGPHGAPVQREGSLAAARRAG